MKGTQALAALAPCLLMTALGCGPVVPRPNPTVQAAPSPDPAATTEPVPGADDPTQGAAAQQRRHLRLAWTTQTRPFNKGVALAATGHVAVLGSRSLSLHHGRSGARLAEADVCFTFADAFAFVAEDMGALVCEDAVRLYSVPELDYRGMRELPGQARVASFVPGRAAVGFASGPVRIYDTPSWEERQVVEVDQRVTALALSADGQRLALGLEQGEIVVHHLSNKAARRVSVKRGLEVVALAFSPEGSQVFAAAGPLAAVWDLDAQTLRRRFRTVADVSRARWLGPDEIASAGRDGLLLLDVAEGAARSLGGGWSLGSGTAAGLAVAPDRQVVCAAEREGEVACFSRGKLPATGQLPVTAGTAVGAGRTMAGRVVVLQGTRLQVRALAGSTFPAAGTDVTILRYTEAQVGPVRTARWLAVAKGRVIKLKKDVVHLRIAGAVKDLPDVTDPLVYDTAVRLTWQPTAPAESK
ncbi:MAG: hypothetical protein JRI68_09450 [Deltaproteobacteria bacterium]|nr:hypothetical protein [Deltaproteobacteria bacterium]